MASYEYATSCDMDWIPIMGDLDSDPHAIMYLPLIVNLKVTFVNLGAG